MSTIMSRDELTRSITQMIVTQYGSLENFGHAYNDMLDRVKNDTIELILEHSIQQGRYYGTLLEELQAMDEEQLIVELERLEETI